VSFQECFPGIEEATAGTASNKKAKKWFLSVILQDILF
jgi:hypothetical protein